jgi:FtsP/CotA-like multicopper oxidase with cupredoxin domain
MITRLALLCAGIWRVVTPAPPSPIHANHNDRPAGALTGGVLSLALVAREGVWHPEAENGFGIPVQAFAEEGRPLEDPGPLIRVPEGTEIRVRVHNAIPGMTLVVHGLESRPGTGADSLVVASGAVAVARFQAGAPGTYFYWGTTTGARIDKRRTVDSQLSGAFVVDPVGVRPSDRIFVIGVWIDSLTVRGVRDKHEIPTINGKMFPYTQSFTYNVGDSVRWRVINVSDREHPMHLHGFYYRVDSRGDALGDTLFATDRRMWNVTVDLFSGTTMALIWVPDRPGNWIFHCHILYHVTGDLTLAPRPPGSHGGMEPMSGLVIPLHVRAAPGASYPATVGTPRQLRLLVQSRPAVYRNDPGFGFVLQDGDRVPAADSIRIPGSPIVLTRGEPVHVTVVNRLQEATAVHWHGIELTSYYDGVPGMSGDPGHLLPSILPGDSLVAAYTAPRAGTFIYHTHVDDIKQMEGGLYGPLIVLPPGEQFDSATDHIVTISLHEYPDTFNFLMNGSPRPDPLVLQMGVPNRIRFVIIPAAGSGVVALVSDSSPVTWRALAKDGADLPPALATSRPARQFMSVGETYDFEIVPLVGQSLQLELRDGGVLLAKMPVVVR